ncbi:MAG: hypothetical protein JW969_11265 [Spirochaetales bacterium]|nr:hypothetical protein [Spirochaetales bacterium]
MKTLTLSLLIFLVFAFGLNAQSVKLGMTLAEVKAILGTPTSGSVDEGYYEWKSQKILGYKNTLVKLRVFKGKVYTYTYSFTDEAASNPVLKGLLKKYKNYKLSADSQDYTFIQEDKNKNPEVQIVFHRYKGRITLTYLDMEQDAKKRKADEEAEEASQPKVDLDDL